MSVDLSLVVGEQHVVEVEIAVGEPRAEPFPDRDDLGVVGDRAEQQRRRHHDTSPKSGMPHMMRPTKSDSASLVGAMIEAARASRKLRSMPTSLRKAAPPPMRIARSVTSSAFSAAI